MSDAKQKSSPRKSQTDEAGRMIERVWGDMPVEDSDEDLTVVMLACDVKNASPKDFTSCVFAQACIRSFGSSKVIFCRTVAYVDLPAGKRGRVVKRFLATQRMRDMIEAFDRGEKDLPADGFTLKKVPPSHRLDYRREGRSRKEVDHRKRVIEGAVIPGNQGKNKYSQKPMVIDLTVRNGSGLVQFAHTSDDPKTPKAQPKQKGKQE